MANFPYTDDIPLATNNPSQDSPDMKINTNSIDSLIAVDHISFNTNSGGAHKQCQISSQSSTGGAIPSGLLGNGFETIYSSVTSAQGDLWFVRGASLTGIQLTGPGTPLADTNGYTFIPGGILIQWGLVTGISTAQHVANATSFNIEFPTECLNVITTPIPIASGVSSQATIGVQSYGTDSFDWVYNKETGTSYTSFTWFAIGN